MRFSNVMGMLAIASTALAQSTQSICVEPNPTCNFLPARSASPCSSIISVSKIYRPTCTKATTTTVKTVTSKSTSTKTVTVDSTKTVSETKNLAGATVIVTKTDVITKYTTSVVKSIKIKAATKTVTETIENTTSLASQTCVPAKRAVEDEEEEFEKRANLPADCSCYITSTKTYGIYTIVLTSIKPAGTVTSTSTRGTTITRSFVASTVTNVNTKKATLAITELKTTTTTSTKTYTATSTVIKLRNKVCLEPKAYGKKYSAVSIKAEDPVDADDLSDCCEKCYEKKGCALYVFDTKKKTCTLSHVIRQTSCKTGFCPLGLSSLTKGATVSDQLTGLGPCAGSAVAP